MPAPLSRRAWLAHLAAGTALVVTGRQALAAERLAAIVAAPGPRLTVYKDPNCGCCEQWVGHMAQAGFRPAVQDVSDMDAVKRRLGVPAALASCHTAVVEGYVLEGHVPATDVQRLLKERPKAKGLAVPGMPVGSPGMEQGPPSGYDRYETLLVQADGRTRRWATHGPAR
jgi:hypothetical protein